MPERPGADYADRFITSRSAGVTSSRPSIALACLGAVLDQPAFERDRRQRGRVEEALDDVAAELGQLRSKTR
ncbi:hypothetical protein [Bradyrhizobium japonicum]|uniref:Uncharacterized protein n=1 Tax=Bradyrhizobium japonicum TaxID=375 RepID=A0ABV2RQH5_BRAJP|nr:hypothetical protein [Bradyrhizobium japonicum]MBR0732769.1 hypothetical protein [Bradyrhizobium japonicum]MBR0808138.1 hypothetical protein [Bradyrhizobium japonicum]MCP1763844.1 hypothetical protein [Bradyrhizobium japonicum]MCP1785981.1 hypothetical protein [Bradyrhizobium japonicum]MCP1807860.1 hypothetical protein [Bradyrhizobium japonicum]